MKCFSKGEQLSVLALDLGASSGRAIVGTYSRVRGLQLTEVHRFDNGPKAGTNPMQWDYDMLLDNIIAGIHEASAKFDLESIGIYTWGVDYGLLDEEGNLLSYPVHYRDARTDGVTFRLAREGELDGLYAITGTQQMDINTLMQIIASRDDMGQSVDDANCALLMPDLLIYSLTGSKATEISMASTTQLMDARSGTWSAEVFGRFGIRDGLFPPIVAEGQPAGMLKDGVAGLQVPVVRVCEHDTASAVASLALTDEDLFVSCGTWSLVGVKCMEPVLTDEAEALNVTNERGDGSSTLLLKNCTGLWIAQELRRNLIEQHGDAPGWIEIAALAFNATPYSRLIDTNDPSLEKPGNMLERINRLLLKTGQEPIEPSDIGSMYRCIYESLALQYVMAKVELEGLLGKKLRSIHLIGGGAQNRFICQSVANVARCPVQAGPFEATAVGNILVQLVSTGLFGSMDEARDAVADSLEHVDYEPKEPISAEVLDHYRYLIGM